jgi:hypothetical protein
MKMPAGKCLRFGYAVIVLAVMVSSLAVGSLCYADSALAAAGSSYAGVDETVIERYAEKAGRKAQEPLINTDRGDMLLFVFLVAGAAGGFVMGYYWRAIFVDGEAGRHANTDVQVKPTRVSAAYDDRRGDA